jgi:hypothetical protein
LQLQGTSPTTFDSSEGIRATLGVPSAYLKYGKWIDENASMCVNSWITRDTCLLMLAASRENCALQRLSAPKMGRSHWSLTHELE